MNEQEELKRQLAAAQKERDEVSVALNTANLLIGSQADANDKLVRQITQERDSALAEVAQFRTAMELEKKPDWGKWLKDLADKLDSLYWKSVKGVLTLEEGRTLLDAARQLRYMADSFTLKANFVPSNLRIKELEAQNAKLDQQIKELENVERRRNKGLETIALVTKERDLAIAELAQFRWRQLDNGVPMRDWIALIQSDARQGMVPRSELEASLAACAAKDEALRDWATCPTCGGTGVFKVECQACLYCEPNKCNCTCSEIPNEVCPQCKGIEEAQFARLKAALALTCGEGWKSPEDCTNLERRLAEYEKQWTDMNYTIGKQAEETSQLKAQNAKLEVEAGAMREAIKPVVFFLTDYLKHFNHPGGSRIRSDLIEACEGKAGQSLLDELERLRAAAKEASECINEWRKVGFIVLDGDDPVLKLLSEALQQKGEKLVWERYVDDGKGMRVEPPEREQQKGEK